MKRFAWVMGLVLLCLHSGAIGASTCLPRIENAWVRAAPPMAPTFAGYLQLRNPCKTRFEIVGVESRDFAMPMIHRTQTGADGSSRMRDAGVLILEPGKALSFQPGGLHLMLMRPLHPIREGDRIGARLVLKDGRRVFAQFPVRRNPP